MRNRLGRGPAVMTFLAVELLSSQVGAGASLSGWQLIGPPGGSVEFDPSTSEIVVAGTQGLATLRVRAASETSK